MESETQLVKPGIVDLPVSVDELKTKAEQFKKLKEELLTPDDYVKIGDKKYIKKSGIFQFALAFNLKTEIIKEVKEIDSTNTAWYAYHFTVRCTAPNGRITEKAGSCSNDEKSNDEKPMHTSVHKVRSMAETRASNRAISAMVGSSEVSAEEMQGVKDDVSKRNGNGIQCSCDIEKVDVTPDKKGCRTCHKALSEAKITRLISLGKIF